MPRRVLAGCDSHLTEFGNGARRALLLHCSLGHSGAYAKLGAATGGELTITSFDQPGHGRSADWTGEGDFQDQVTAMALELMDAPMDLIGHSFGGGVALRIAIERPELVRTLTLCEPAMMSIALRRDPSLRHVLDRDLQGINAAFDAGAFEEAARLFTQRYGDGRPWESLSEENRAALTSRIHLIRAGGRAVNEDYYGLLEPGRLERAAMPVLVVDGGLGGPMMDGVCEGLLERLPNAQRVRIPGAGHMVPITRPGAVAREILQLLRGDKARDHPAASAMN
jgi:lipase